MSRCSYGRCRPYEWRPVHSALSGLSSDVRYMIGEITTISSLQPPRTVSESQMSDRYIIAESAPFFCKLFEPYMHTNGQSICHHVADW